MATIIGTQNITHNGVALEFKKAFDRKYEGEIKKGTTTIKKSLITNGSALWRLTHGGRGTIESHKFSLELDRYRDGETKADSRLVKMDVLLTCVEDDPIEQTEMCNLIDTVCAYLPTIKSDIVADAVE